MWTSGNCCKFNTYNQPTEHFWCRPSKKPTETVTTCDHRTEEKAWCCVDCYTILDPQLNPYQHPQLHGEIFCAVEDMGRSCCCKPRKSSDLCDVTVDHWMTATIADVSPNGVDLHAHPNFDLMALQKEDDVKQPSKSSHLKIDIMGCNWPSSWTELAEGLQHRWPVLSTLCHRVWLGMTSWTWLEFKWILNWHKLHVSPGFFLLVRQLGFWVVCTCAVHGKQTNRSAVVLVLKPVGTARLFRSPTLNMAKKLMKWQSFTWDIVRLDCFSTDESFPNLHPSPPASAMLCNARRPSLGLLGSLRQASKVASTASCLVSWKKGFGGENWKNHWIYTIKKKKKQFIKIYPAFSRKRPGKNRLKKPQNRWFPSVRIWSSSACHLGAGIATSKIAAKSLKRVCLKILEWTHGTMNPEPARNLDIPLISRWNSSDKNVKFVWRSIEQFCANSTLFWETTQQIVRKY